MVRFLRHKAGQAFATVLLSALCALVLAACDKTGPSVDSRLVATYVDIRAMEQSIGTETPEARLARKSIVEQHGYTLESYKAAIDKVLNNAESWVPFQQAVINRIDSLMGNAPSAPPVPQKGAP